MPPRTSKKKGATSDKKPGTKGWGIVRGAAPHATFPVAPKWNEGEVEQMDWEEMTTKASGRKSVVRGTAEPFEQVVSPERVAARSTSCGKFMSRLQNSPLVDLVKAVARGMSVLPAKTLPWDLIYPRDYETGLPTLTANGRHAVKLFWMSEWRMIVVDLTVPFDRSMDIESEDGKGEFSSFIMKLVQTNTAGRTQAEAWFSIICRAIFKLLRGVVHRSKKGNSIFEDVSFVHLLSGLSVEEHPLTQSVRTTSRLAPALAESASSEHIWQLLLSTFQGKKVPRSVYRFCTATYIASMKKAPAESKTHEGGGTKPPVKLGLDLNTGHTAHVHSIKEVQSNGVRQRLVHLKSSSIVWQGAMSWTNAECWPADLQRVLGVNRLREMAKLRVAMTKLVQGEDHTLFNFWMLFDDFLDFFHIVQMYHDTQSLDHQAIHQRGETTGFTTGKGRPGSRRKQRNSAHTKSAHRKNSATGRDGEVDAATADHMTLLVDCSVATKLYLTFSAYGSKDKYLDGTSLPPGHVSITVSSPFEEQADRCVAQIATSFTGTRILDLTPGRHVFELHYTGSKRSAIAASAANSVCSFDTAKVTHTLRAESAIFRADTARFTLGLSALLSVHEDADACASQTLHLLVTNPLCRDIPATIYSILDLVTTAVCAHMDASIATDVDTFCTLEDGLRDEVVLADGSLEIRGAANTEISISPVSEADTVDTATALIKSPSAACGSNPTVSTSVSGGVTDGANDAAASSNNICSNPLNQTRLLVAHRRAWLAFASDVKAKADAFLKSATRVAMMDPADAASVIQRTYRHYRARECAIFEVFRYARALKTIQRYGRGYLARLHTARLRSAETDMQRLLRLMTAGQYDASSAIHREPTPDHITDLATADEATIHAAIVIQSAIRCANTRRRYIIRRDRTRALWPKLANRAWNRFIAAPEFGAAAIERLWRDVLVQTPAALARYPNARDFNQTRVQSESIGSFYWDYNIGTVLLFRELVQFEEATRIIATLSVLAGSVGTGKTAAATDTSGTAPIVPRLRAIDLDTGVDAFNRQRGQSAVLLKKNDRGYLFIGEVMAEGLPIDLADRGLSGTWTLSALCDTGTTITPQSAKSSATAVPLVESTYFCDTHQEATLLRDRSLFRIKLGLDVDHTVALYLQTDQPNVEFTIAVRDEATGETLHIAQSQAGAIHVPYLKSLHASSGSCGRILEGRVTEDWSPCRMLPPTLKYSRVYEPEPPSKARVRPKGSGNSHTQTKPRPSSSRHPLRTEPAAPPSDGLVWGLRVFHNPTTQIERVSKDNLLIEALARQTELTKQLDECIRAAPENGPSNENGERFGDVRRARRRSTVTRYKEDGAVAASTAIVGSPPGVIGLPTVTQSVVKVTLSTNPHLPPDLHRAAHANGVVTSGLAPQLTRLPLWQHITERTVAHESAYEGRVRLRRTEQTDRAYWANSRRLHSREARRELTARADCAQNTKAAVYSTLKALRAKPVTPRKRIYRVR